jgi:putative transport protein
LSRIAEGNVAWLFQLHATQPVAQAIGVLALVCAAGKALGNVKIRGIGLGSAGVLFAGIITGYFSKPVDHATLAFVKEFGLLLFVFTIGLQLGPGFFSALRRDGLRLNTVALFIVLAGSALTVLFGWLFGLDSAAVLGILSGATTSTPSLGAAEQALASIPGISDERLALPALAYAVTYPVAIVGIIGTLLALKSLFRIDMRTEVEALTVERGRHVEPLETRTLIVENPNLDDVAVEAIPLRAETGVIVSRYRPAGESEVRAAVGGTRLHTGDSIMVVGRRAMLDQFQCLVGRQGGDDLRFAPGNVTERTIVVTRGNVLGKTIGELAFDARCGIVVSRLTRADVSLTAVPGLPLKFGDMVQAVGDEQGLDQAEKLLGNSVKELGQTQFMPLFIGIALGIIVGTMPIVVPGLQQPLQLGLAGGPLVVALILGHLGRIGRLVFYMPVNTNLAFREFGIALFFAAVGLAAGPTLFATVFSSTGLLWLGAGLCVTVLPVLLTGLVTRALLHMNFAVLGGLIAGSMTDPPALTFIGNLANSDAPTLAYVTVYPLTTVLRILAAQVLALMLTR